MSCNNCSSCQPCTCVPYVDTGCLDTYNTDCVKYTGDDISCLEINTGDTLTEILVHLEDVICALSPNSWDGYDYSCLSTLNVSSQQEFVEGISAYVCDLKTDLDTLSDTVVIHTASLNTLGSVTTLDCFETISGLPGATATPSALFAAIQQVLCDHEDEITALQALGGVPLTVNDSTSINFTASGTANHTLTAAVIVSPGVNNSISIESDGLYVEEVPIVVVDTDTIDFTSSGVLGHTITADVNISTDPNNRLVVLGDGLFVAGASFSETALTANDSNSIDFTTSGTSAHTLTGSVRIDPAVDNIISITTDGLYASGSSFSVTNNSVGDAQLRDSSSYSVVGRTSGSTGDPADIVAGADGVLRRSGSGNLAFGTIVTGNIGDDQVTFVKTQNISTQKILGRGTAGSGDIEQLSLGTNLTLSGTTLNTYGRTLIGVTKFTSSGTWTKPTGCNAIEVVVVGGGGGGAGADASASQASVGSGGGAGGHCRYFFTSLFGSSETVTIGAGGEEGNSGNAYTGAAGGNTLFGTIAKANGGSGGSTLVTGTTVGTSGVGAAGSNAIPSGNLTMTGLLYGGQGGTGSVGVRLSATVTITGLGGSSILGGGGAEESYGCGGDGGSAVNGTTDDGNAGTQGYVLVYEYS